MIFLTLSFILGTIVGSFLNVCIYRLPAQQSIIRPPSHCRSCLHPIKFYDNIPLLSFILLQGRCRHCQVRIPYQYPLVELTAGVLSLIFMLRYGVSIAYLFYFAFSATLLTATVIDIKHQIIPDRITLPGIAVGFLRPLFFSQPTLLDSLFGTLLGGGSLLMVAGGYYLLTKREGMGFGDVKLLAMIGAFLGWKSIPFTIMIASLTGTAVGITLMLIKKKDIRYAIPFGPFLSLGALSYLLYERELIHLSIYLQGWLKDLVW